MRSTPLWRCPGSRSYGIVTVGGALTRREERLPLNALRVFDPALLAFGVAARGRSFLEHEAVGALQPRIDLLKLGGVLDLSRGA